MSSVKNGVAASIVTYTVKLGIPIVATLVFFLLPFDNGTKAIVLMLAAAVTASLNVCRCIRIDPIRNVIENHYLVLGFVHVRFNISLDKYDSIGYYVISGTEGTSAIIRILGGRQGRTILKLFSQAPVDESSMEKLTKAFAENCSLHFAGKLPYLQFMIR